MRGGTTEGMFLRRSEEDCLYWSEEVLTGTGDARAARELIGELLWDGASAFPLSFLDVRLELEGEELLFCEVA